jgi:hypothetical protein
MTKPHEAAAKRDDPTAIATSRGDRDRALEAMQALEGATGAAGPGRDEQWRAAVATALSSLQAALAEQKASYEDPGSLMVQLAQDDPRLRTWVRQLHHRWNDLAATADTLARELEPEAAGPAIADIREQVRWLISALHHHRAREADLVYTALRVDISRAPAGPDERATRRRRERAA